MNNKKKSDAALSTPRRNRLKPLAKQRLTRHILIFVLAILISRGIESVHGKLLEEHILISVGEVLLLLEHGVLLMDGAVVVGVVHGEVVAVHVVVHVHHLGVT